MKYDLNKRIDGLLSSAYHETDDEDYQGSFAHEGFRKAQYIIDDLNYRSAKYSINQANLVYLCIGGADGSEVEAILSNTGINYAIMVEISTEGSNEARKRAARLKQSDKTLVVLEGDIGTRLDDAIEKAENWLTNGSVTGLVCSAQAVLHELPLRSPNYDESTLMGKIFRNSNWEVKAFYAREPSMIIGWPAKVRIRVPGLTSLQLVRFSRYVGDRLRMPGKPEAIGNNWVVIPSQLAVETLHKLIRNGSLKRIGYELGEQLTSFDPIATKNNLQSLVDGMMVTVDYITTSGFKTALRDYDVEYMGHNSEALPIPKTHSELIGFQIEEKTIIKKPTPKTSNVQPSRLESIQFHNPFRTFITDADVRAWLAQFKKEDQDSITKLLEAFTFLSFSKTQKLAEKLYQNLVTKLGDKVENAWFVPLASTAKSSDLISYIFRSINKIPAERFTRLDSLESPIRSGDPIVFLDDILASGHQASSIWSNAIEKKLFPVENEVFLATIVACEPGTTFLNERTPLSTVNALFVERSRSPFSANSILFPDIDERERLRNILSKYAEYFDSSTPFGYSGFGLLLSFEHSVPDNVPPIFWASSEYWTPLLTRSSPGRPSFPNY